MTVTGPNPNHSNPSSPKQADPAFYKRRRRRGDEIGQLLLNAGAVTAEQLREALVRQKEAGGHVGAILRNMGACGTRDIALALEEQSQVRAEFSQVRESLAERARENPSHLGIEVECRPHLVRALLVLSDMLTLALGAVIVGLFASPSTLETVRFFGVLALMPVCVFAFAAVHLYGIPPPSPPEELRRTTLTTTFVYGAFWLVTALMSGSFATMSHWAWGIGLLLSILGVPMLRGITRTVFGGRPWWGYPVVVIGAGKVGRAVVGTLKLRPELGLRPVAILDDNPSRHGTLRAQWGEDDVEVEGVDNGPPSSSTEVMTSSRRTTWEKFSEIEGVPILGGMELAPILGQRLGIEIAVLADPELHSTRVLQIIEAYADGYTNVLVIPDLFDLAQFGAPTKNLGGMMGIEVRRQLLLAGPRFAKRLMDITLTTVGGLLISPLVLLITLAVRLDSAGSPFYRQKRLGQDGVRFDALKFRTMYGDGERRLQEVLSRDPKLRAEYEEFHKLSDDPRVTQVGKLLRKYSLDELPQLWNVLAGDMSLVGPRPYLAREIPEMKEQECTVLRVKPGITGYWQVTERNSSSFERRVRIDVEYVRNWSPWLDIYVLARTVPVVLGGTGS
jgi:lipopolysaccharide/colanic/teichoic acid biosynthesis glycosyltransferase